MTVRYRRAIRRGHYAAAIAILDARRTRRARTLTYATIGLWVVAVLSWAAIAAEVLP